jgi:hypothetical protein
VNKQEIRAKYGCAVGDTVYRVGDITTLGEVRWVDLTRQGVTQVEVLWDGSWDTEIVLSSTLRRATMQFA